MIALTLLFSIVPKKVEAQAPIKIWIHGKYVESDVPPFIENGRTLVPIRLLSENLQCNVKWQQDSKSVKIFRQLDDKVDIFFVLALDNPLAIYGHMDYITELYDKSLLSDKQALEKAMTNLTTKYELWDAHFQQKLSNGQIVINSEEEALNKAMNDFNNFFEGQLNLSLIDVPPQIVNDRTFVPIRFVAESLNETVDWDNETRTVIIGEGY